MEVLVRFCPTTRSPQPERSAGHKMYKTFHLVDHHSKFDLCLIPSDGPSDTHLWARSIRMFDGESFPPAIPLAFPTSAFFVFWELSTGLSSAMVLVIMVGNVTV